MPKAPDFPKVIKAGSVAVKVYRVKHKSTSSGWAYVLAWTSGGRRRLQQFASETEATEEGRIKGYLAGTDDYLAKPFNIAELHARVTRLLRRSYGIS